MFTSSVKRQIGRFHVVVVQWTSKKCTKKCDARAELLIWSLNLLFLWSWRCGRRLSSLSSLLSETADISRHRLWFFRYFAVRPVVTSLNVGWFRLRFVSDLVKDKRLHGDFTALSWFGEPSRIQPKRTLSFLLDLTCQSLLSYCFPFV